MMMLKYLRAILVAVVASFCLHGPSQAGEEGGTSPPPRTTSTYNSPVEPRRVIGIMRAGTGTSVLAYHRDGWCKLSLKAFIGRSGRVAADHLNGCPPRGQ
jgi:hypothetical protein